MEHGRSDHFAITCDLSLKKPKALRKTISSRNLRSMDRQAFREGLHAALSGNDLQSDVHSLLEHYDESLKALLNRLAPKRTRTVVLKPSFPWTTDAICDARCLRRQLERRWRASKTELNRKLYMKQKRVVSRLIEQAKRDHYSSIVTDCHGDQKRLFHVINDLLNRKKDAIFPDTICDQDLANRFSDFFCKENPNHLGCF